MLAVTADNLSVTKRENFQNVSTKVAALNKSSSSYNSARSLKKLMLSYSTYKSVPIYVDFMPPKERVSPMVGH